MGAVKKLTAPFPCSKKCLWPLRINGLETLFAAYCSCNEKIPETIYSKAGNYVDNLSKNTGCNITVDLATLRDIAIKAVTMPFGARWAKARVNALLDEMVYEEPFETRYVYCQNKERTVTAHDEETLDPPY